MCGLHFYEARLTKDNRIILRYAYVQVTWQLLVLVHKQ